MGESFVVIDEALEGEMGKVTVLECSPKSEISRSCAIRFSCSGGNVQVDCCALENQINLIDQSGQALVLPRHETICAPTQGGTRWKLSWSRHIIPAVMSMSLRPVLTRCYNCRRRARDRRERDRDRRTRAAAATELDGISMPELAAAALDADADVGSPGRGMRTALRDSQV